MLTQRCGTAVSPTSIPSVMRSSVTDMQMSAVLQRPRLNHQVRQPLQRDARTHTQQAHPHTAHTSAPELACLLAHVAPQHPRFTSGPHKRLGWQALTLRGANSVLPTVTHASLTCELCPATHFRVSATPPQPAPTLADEGGWFSGVRFEGWSVTTAGEVQTWQ